MAVFTQEMLLRLCYKPFPRRYFSALDPFHSNININILHTVLFTLRMVLTRRI